MRKRILVGLSSGIGNCVCMLPALKALRSLGHCITLHVETDQRTAELWRRCVFADQVVEPPAVADGYDAIMCGQWRPASWAAREDIKRYWIAAPYRMPEWVSNMRLAVDEGYKAEIPDVFEWCADVNRTVRWDVGIVPGCKGGDWLRKRWDGMATASRMLVQLGYKVAVFGQPEDGVRGMAGEWVQTPRIEMVPDALAGCRMILGTDSGLTQLAASLGVPVVAVFTATSAIKGLPMGHNNTILQTRLECQPCQSTVMWHACRNWRCQAIEPAAAVQAVRETLGD